MEFFDTTSTDVVNYYILGPTSGTFLTTMPLTETNVVMRSDKDWMPYKFFEYDPLWHKKYAAIKNQMDTMWD